MLSFLVAKGFSNPRYRIWGWMEVIHYN